MNRRAATLREQRDEAACLAGRQAKLDTTIAVEWGKCFGEDERLMAEVRDQRRQVNHVE